jgi:hypothetical protein
MKAKAIFMTKNERKQATWPKNYMVGEVHDEESGYQVNVHIFLILGNIINFKDLKTISR